MGRSAFLRKFMKETKWEILRRIVTVIGIIPIAGWGIRSCVRSEDRYREQHIIINQSNTVYSFQHPEIVGTNENGKVVKRYYDYTHNATIYEIGKTKTEVIDRGKFGITTNVSVEE